MIKLNRYISHRKYILLMLFIIIIMLVLQPKEKPTSGLFDNELQSTLYNQEVVIDYAQEEGIVYALLNQKGLLSYGDLFVVYRPEKDGGWERVYENDFNDLRPWKIERADIDGDEEQEILIAVCKTTHYDKIEKNRMFIFNYKGEKLYKKWTGSQISGIWKDFYVGDVVSIPGSELIFIEQLEDKSERINIYYWFDFGFALLATSESYKDIQNLSIIGENRIQITSKENEKDTVITLMVKDGTIIETISE